MKRILAILFLTIFLAGQNVYAEETSATGTSLPQTTVTPSQEQLRIKQKELEQAKNALRLKQATQTTHVSTDTASAEIENALGTLRAGIGVQPERAQQTVDALRKNAAPLLADMPAWITGVCSSATDTSCDTVKAALKEKCETVAQGVQNAVDGSAVKDGCASIDSMTCADITAACAKAKDALANRDAKLAEIQARITETRTDIAEKLEARKEAFAEKIEALTERAKERIKAYGIRVIERMTAAANRLTKLADRIDSRIAKIESANTAVDTSEATSLVSDARVHIAAAQESLTDASSLIAEALASDDARSAVDIVRESLKDAADSLRTAKEKLHTAITSLKNIPGTTVDTSSTE